METVLLSASRPKRPQEAQEQHLCGGNDSLRGQRHMGATLGGEQLQRAFWPAQPRGFSGPCAIECSPKTLGGAGTHRAWGSSSFVLPGHHLPLQEIPSKWPCHLQLTSHLRCPEVQHPRPACLQRLLPTPTPPHRDLSSKASCHRLPHSGIHLKGPPSAPG